MRPEGIEILLQALRRSLWIAVLLVAVGAIAMNVLRHQQGPEYTASARVLLSPTDVAAALAGVQNYVDPSRADASELSLAQSPQLFTAAAARSLSFSGDELEGATSVSQGDSGIVFTASAPTPGRATAIANAVAAAYPSWRAEVTTRRINEAIVQLQRQVRAQRSNPDLLALLNRLKVMRTVSSGNVLLVERADSAAKVRPSPVRDTVLGSLIGLFLALVIAGLREVIDTKVRSEADIEELLRVPVVGTVETLPRRTRLLGSARRHERYNDMYALLAANLLANREEGESLVIAVTSATAQEGKTTTASNLATALARRNERVLLVDMDTRRPSLARLFGVPEGATGLQAVLSREARLEGAVWDVRQDAVGASVDPVQSESGSARRGGLTATRTRPRLQLLPLSGGLGDAGLGRSGRVPELVEELRAWADIVVIDTPPALATPHATELAPLVDSVLVVVRQGRVSRRTLAALHRIFGRRPTTNMSAVLVGTPRQETYSYYASQ